MFPCDVIAASKRVLTGIERRRDMIMIRKIGAAVMFLVCIWTLSGCHTVHGVGEDIESGGRAIERSSGK
jgi:predicted small secreted protein